MKKYLLIVRPKLTITERGKERFIPKCTHVIESKDWSKFKKMRIGPFAYTIIKESDDLIDFVDDFVVKIFGERPFIFPKYDKSNEAALEEMYCHYGREIKLFGCIWKYGLHVEPILEPFADFSESMKGKLL